jgi:hypothetical protein
MAFMQLTRSKFPDTPMWAENILDLQKQLVQARQVTERLCQDLETPSSSDRWIELGGEDPDIEKLKLRIVQLEARVNGAREELLEKDLILEEITSLAERLQAAASAATDTVAAASAGASLLRSPEAPGLTLAKSANELQGKIKDTNRKLMAVVSELSMYQATAIKLADETAAAQDALTKAEAALSRGLPPTVAAEQRWQFTERARSLTSSGVGTKLYVARRLWKVLNRLLTLGRMLTFPKELAYRNRMVNFRRSNPQNPEQSCGFSGTLKYRKLSYNQPLTSVRVNVKQKLCDFKLLVALCSQQLNLWKVVRLCALLVMVQGSSVFVCGFGRRQFWRWQRHVGTTAILRKCGKCIALVDIQ